MEYQIQLGAPTRRLCRVHRTRVFRRHSTFLACLVLAVLVGCEDRISPLQPTPLQPTPPQPTPPQPPIDVRPVHSRFNDFFWQQLVFNQYLSSTGWGSLVLDTTSPNVYIRMGDPNGRRVVSDQLRDHILEAIPRLATQLTGRSYRGRIESGIGDRIRAGWITVRFVTQEEEPEVRCGRAARGDDPGSIWIGWISRDGTREVNCVHDLYFPQLFAHEFGHAMGFSHVADPDRTAIMAAGISTPTDTFNASEQYHARLAYEVGRGHKYCGWPFQRSCATPKSLGLRGLPQPGEVP